MLFVRCTLIALVVAVGLTIPARADIIVLNPSLDNSIYQVGSLGAEQRSNGIGDGIFAGKTNGGLLRRGLLEFDLSAIPSGSTINSVELRLTLLIDPGGATNDHIYNLHRATAAWGEGASNAGSPGGGGASSQTGDASWFYSNFNSQQWTTPGGDFDPTSSGSTSVGETSAQTNYVWSSAGMVGDVQSWLDSPSSNFGWFLIGDETTSPSARKFASSEHANSALFPQLTINYTASAAVPEPTSIVLVGGLVMGRLVAHRRRWQSARR